jgi:hypothetical protein
MEDVAILAKISSSDLPLSGNPGKRISRRNGND